MTNNVMSKSQGLQMQYMSTSLLAWQLGSVLTSSDKVVHHFPTRQHWAIDDPSREETIKRRGVWSNDIDRNFLVMRTLTPELHPQETKHEHHSPDAGCWHNGYPFSATSQDSKERERPKQKILQSNVRDPNLSHLNMVANRMIPSG